MADELDLRMRAALSAAEVEVGRAGFLRYVDEIGRAQVPHLELVAVITDARPIPVETVRCDLQMEILRQHARVEVDGRGRIVTGDVETPVVHHVVEVDADAETVRRLDQTQQVRLRAVERADRAFLVLAAEVEGIVEIVTHRQPAAGLGGRRNPDRIVPGLGQFGHPGGDLVPTRVEILQHRLRAQGRRPGQREDDEEGKRQPTGTGGLHAERGISTDKNRCAGGT